MRVACGCKNGTLNRHVFKEIGLCSKYVNYSMLNSQQFGGPTLPVNVHKNFHVHNE